VGKRQELRRYLKVPLSSRNVDKGTSVSLRCRSVALDLYYGLERSNISVSVEDQVSRCTFRFACAEWENVLQDGDVDP
jgi:hypothetical protein